jgi:pilus assembly protein CpaF
MASAPYTPVMNGTTTQELGRLRLWVAEKLEASLAPNVKLERSPEVVQLIHERFKLLCQHAKIQLAPDQLQPFFTDVVEEILGYGPLEALLHDEDITEVMVNGPGRTYVEKKGKLTPAEVSFVDDEHLLRIINKIVTPLGRRVDRSSPMVDARLPDGSRVNAIIPPCAIDGPSLTIRRFSKDPLKIGDLVKFGSLSEHMALLLEACVVSRLNVVVAGGTGSGKTTLLNVLSSFIPADDRIVTIEDSAELQLQQPHVVRLETKHAEPDGSGRVTIRDLVVNSLRMRPERIVIGECRSGEALDMLQAMNTGHDGSLTTVHANSPRDTLARLETLVLMAGVELPVRVVRQQIASAVDLIVQQARLRDGTRKVTNISEVIGLEGETVVLQDIFKFVEKGEEDGIVQGEFEPGGLRPTFTPRLKAYGYELPGKLFMKF